MLNHSEVSVEAIVASFAFVISNVGAMLLEEHEQLISSPVQHEFPVLQTSSSSQPSSYVSRPSVASSGFDGVNSEYYRHYDHSATAVVESRTTPTGHTRYADGSGSMTSSLGGVSAFGSLQSMRQHGDHPSNYGTVSAPMAPQLQPPNGPTYGYPQYPPKEQIFSAKDQYAENRYMYRTPSSTITSPTSNIAISSYQDRNTLPLTGHPRAAPDVRYSPSEYTQTQPITLAPQFQPPNGPTHRYPQYPSEEKILSANDQYAENRYMYRTPSSTITSPTSNIAISSYQDRNTLPLTGHPRAAPDVRYAPTEYTQTQPITFTPGYSPGQRQLPTSQHLMFDNVDLNKLYPKAQVSMPQRPVFDRPDQIVEIINGIPHITKFIRGPRATTTRPPTLPVSPNAPLLPYPSYTQPAYPPSPLNGVVRTHPMTIPMMEPSNGIDFIPGTHYMPSPERPNILTKYSPTHPQPKEMYAPAYPLPTESPQFRYPNSAPPEETVILYPTNFNSLPSEDNRAGAIDYAPNMRTPYSPPAPRRIYIVRSERFVRESYAPGEAPRSIRRPTPVPLSSQYVPSKEDVPAASNNFAPADTKTDFPLYPSLNQQGNPQPKIVYLPIDESPVEGYPWNQYPPTPAYHSSEPLPRNFGPPGFSNYPENEPGILSPQTSYEVPINYLPSSPIRKSTSMPPVSYGTLPSSPTQPRQPYSKRSPLFDEPNSSYKTVPLQQYRSPPIPTSQQYPSYPSQPENHVPSQETEPRPYETYPQKQYPAVYPVDQKPDEIYYVDASATPDNQLHPSSRQPLQQLPHQRMPFRNPPQPNIEYITDYDAPEPSSYFQDHPPSVPRSVKVIRKVVIRRIVTNTSHPDIEYIYPEEIPLPQYPSQPGGLHPKQTPHYPDELQHMAQPKQPYPSPSPFFDETNPNSPYGTVPHQQYPISPIQPSQKYLSYPSQPENGIPRQTPQHGPYETAPQTHNPIGSPKPTPQMYPSSPSQPSNYPRQSNQPSIPYEMPSRDQYPPSPQSPASQQQPLYPPPSVHYTPQGQTEPQILNPIPQQQHPTNPDHLPQTQRPAYPSPSFLIPSDRNEPLLQHETAPDQQYPASPTYPSQQQQYPLHQPPVVSYIPTRRAKPTTSFETAPDQQYPINPAYYPSQPQQLFNQPLSVHHIPNDRAEPIKPLKTASNQQYPVKPFYYPFEQQNPYNPSDESEPLIPSENAPKQQYPSEPSYSPSQPQNPSYPSSNVHDNPSDITEPFSVNDNFPRQQYTVIPTQQSQPLHPAYPSPLVNRITAPEPEQLFAPLTPRQTPSNVVEYGPPQERRPILQYPGKQPSSPSSSPTHSPFAMSPEYASLPELPEEQVQYVPVNDRKSPTAQEPVFNPGEGNLNSNPVLQQPGMRHPFSQMPSNELTPEQGYTYPTQQLPHRPRKPIQRFPTHTVYEEEENEEEEILTERKPRPQYAQPLQRHPYGERPSYIPSELDGVPVHSIPTKLGRPHYHSPYEDDGIPIKDFPQDQYPRTTVRHPSRPYEDDGIPIKDIPQDQYPRTTVRHPSRPYEDHGIPVKDIPQDQYPRTTVQHPSRPSSPQLYDQPGIVEPVSQPREKSLLQPSKITQQKLSPAHTTHTYFEEEENEEENIVTRPKPRILRPLRPEGPTNEPQTYIPDELYGTPGQIPQHLEQYPHKPSKYPIKIPAGDDTYYETDHVPKNHYPSSPSQHKPQIEQTIHHYPSDTDTPTELHHPTSDLQAPLGPSLLRRVPQKLPTGNQPHYEYPDEHLSNLPVENSPRKTPYNPLRPKRPSGTHTYFEQEENEEEQILTEPLYPTQHPSSPLRRLRPSQPYLLSPTETITPEELEPGRYPPRQPRPLPLRRVSNQPTSTELLFDDSPYHRDEFPVGNIPHPQHPSDLPHHRNEYPVEHTLPDEYSSRPSPRPSQLTHPQYPSDVDMHTIPQHSKPLHGPSGQTLYSTPTYPDHPSTKGRPHHESPTIEEDVNPTQSIPHKHISQRQPSLRKPKSTHSYYEEEENVEEIMEEHPPLSQHRTSPVHFIQRHPISQSHPEDDSLSQGSKPITHLPFGRLPVEETPRRPSTSGKFPLQPSSGDQSYELLDGQVLQEPQEQYTPTVLRPSPSGRQPNFLSPSNVATIPELFEPTHTTPRKVPDQQVIESMPHYISPDGFQLIEPVEGIPHYPSLVNPPQYNNIPEFSDDTDYDNSPLNKRRSPSQYLPEESPEIQRLNSSPIREKVTKTFTNYKNAIYDDTPSDDYPDGYPFYPLKQHRRLQPEPTGDSPDDDDSAIRRVLNSLPPNFDLSKICPYLDKMRNNKHPAGNEFESGARRPIAIPTNEPIATHSQPTVTHNQPIVTLDDSQPITTLDSHPFVEVSAESTPSSEVYGPTTVMANVDEVEAHQEAISAVDTSALAPFEGEANIPSQKHIPEVTPPPSNPQELPVPASTLPVIVPKLQEPMTSSSFTEKEVEVEEEHNISALIPTTIVPVSPPPPPPPPSNIIEQATKSVSSGVHADTVSHNSGDSLHGLAHEEEPTGSLSRKVMRSRVTEHIESSFTPGGATQEPIVVMPTAQTQTINKRLVMETGSSEMAMAVEDGMIQKTIETPHPSASMKIMSGSMSGGAAVSSGMTTGGGGKMVRYVAMAGSPSVQSGAIISGSSGASQQPTPPRYKLVTIPGSIQTFTPAFPPGTKMITSAVGSGSAPGYKAVRVPVKMVNG